MNSYQNIGMFANRAARGADEDDYDDHVDGGDYDDELLLMMILIMMMMMMASGCLPTKPGAGCQKA